jgi:short-subunit dehydrogenase
MALPPPAPESTALVTGASSGIGSDLARSLAARGHGVTLVARRTDRLERVAAELRDGHRVSVEVIPTDLADPQQREDLVEELERRGLAVNILVNNAGFGIYAPFAALGLAAEFEQVELLVGAVMDLTGRLLPGMVTRGRGAILNVSSTAAFQALPGNGTYAAGKAWVLMHSEALHEEVKDHGVTVTAVCPGPVRSGFQESSKPAFADRLPKFVWRDPDRVARDAVRALERGKRSVIPGGPLVKLFFGFNRVMPAWMTMPVVRRMMARELARGTPVESPPPADRSPASPA